MIGNTGAVLNVDIDRFIEASLKVGVRGRAGVPPEARIDSVRSMSARMQVWQV